MEKHFYPIKHGKQKMQHIAYLHADGSSKAVIDDWLKDVADFVRETLWGIMACW
jgi:hypothetical protein